MYQGSLPAGQTSNAYTNQSRQKGYLCFRKVYRGIREIGMDRNSKHRAVDIVVPIYNGYEDLLCCIESIRRHTDLSRHRVILIDDCSPDKRVSAALREICEGQDKDAKFGLIAYFNEKNMGFSANVNRGLAWSDRDTIMLNSDTIVTHGWVEKLQACAYRSERIATVTPLSNAATLASVPVFLKDNPVQAGYTIDSYAKMVEKVSLHRYPKVPVGVGFCMYVRQDAYALAGEFDEKTFGRGYGEENDFCFRCSTLGYYHVLCDDTFIYHKGTGSFDSEEKRRLIEAHTKVLRERYPQFMEKNDIYCREDPDSEIRDNLLLHQCLDNGKKNLLYLLHLDFRQVVNKSIGGTQLHVRDLVSGAIDEFNVFVCARDRDTLRLTVYLADEGLPEWKMLLSEESEDTRGKMISFKFPIGEQEMFPVFYDEELAAVLRSIIVSCRIDLVHVHHTQGLSLDIYRVCEELQIPVIATLHDYYYACPTTKLLTGDGQFCPRTGHFLDIQEDVCRECLHANCGYDKGNVIGRWRDEISGALRVCEKIVFPSKSAMKIMCSVYPSLEKKSVVIGHGTDIVPSGSVLTKAPANIVKTSRMHTRLDQMPGEGGSFHYIAGWAYLEGSKSIDTSIYIEVTGPDGAKFYLRVRSHARPDVAAAKANPDYLWSGIHAVFQVKGLREGKIKIRILIREETGRKDPRWDSPGTDSGKAGSGKVCFWTDGRVYRTVYRKDSRKTGRLNIAYLGGVTKEKGSGVLKQLISVPNAPFNLYVYGEVGDPTVAARKGADNVFFSGVYQKDDIFDLLRASRIDVALILPILAETFCYTLSEAWECGIPVIGTDIGAVGERIRDTGAGWVIPTDAGKEEVVKLIEQLRRNPEELEKKKKITRRLSMRSVADMNREYDSLYRRLLVPSSPVVVKAGMWEEPEFLFQALAMANPAVKGSGYAAKQNMLREENEMLRASMEMLKNTTSYRFARKISEADIPFKEQLKRLLKKR